MTFPYPVIGIAGKAGTGKDTIADLIVMLRLGGYRYSFADPLRAMLKAGFRIDMYDRDWIRRKEDPVKHLGKSPRQLMQSLGTEWGRNLVHPDIWVKEALIRLLECGPGMVIADVRFDNEAEWVRIRGGKLIHVTRFCAPLVHQHASENGVCVEPGDWSLENDGTIEDLRARIPRLFGAAHAG